MTNKYLLLNAMQKKNKRTTDMTNLLGISRQSFSLKMNDNVRFNVDEISRIKEDLDLSNDDVVSIFFENDVDKTEL